MRGRRFLLVKRERCIVMALGLATESTGGGGDILPIIKFDAKSGDFIRQDRAQNPAGEWEKSESELNLPLQFAADMDALEVGWLSFASGAPDFRMVRVGEEMPAKPSDDHKQCVRLRLFNKELGLREFSTMSKIVLRELDKLHDAYKQDLSKYAGLGKVPVVQVTGVKTVPITTPKGELRFKAPEWSISQWVERPAGMNGPAAQPEAPVEPAAPVPAADEGGDDLF